MKKITTYIDYFLPKDFQNNIENLRKGRLLIVSCFSVVVFSLGYIPMFLASGFIYGSIINFYSAATASAVFLLFRKSGNFNFYGNFFTLVALSVFVAFTPITGGLSSPMLIWFAIIPLSGFLYVNKSAGLFWTFATFFFITLIFVAQEIFGVVFISQYPQEIKNTLFFTNVLGAIGYIVVIIWVYEIGHQTAQESLANAQQKILEKSQELEAINEETTQQTEQLARTLTQVTDSVRYAKRIQQAILPSEDDVLSCFPNAFVMFRPRDIVSGDFYWFQELFIENRAIKILIAGDCTGHGVPGAFMTIIANGLLNDIIISDKFWKPDEILISLEERLQELLATKKVANEVQMSDGMDIVIVSLDEANNKLYFSGAKNPLYYVRNENLLTLKASKSSIGDMFYAPKKQFELHQVLLRKGDVFYLFSDGYQDQFGGMKNKKYMKKNFREFLQTISLLPMEEQGELLTREFDTWKGTTAQTDDVLVIGIGF